jgi:polysaccharide export outer membrane protein
MRAISRKPLLMTTGGLAVFCLVLAGCSNQSAQVLPDAGPGLHPGMNGAGRSAPSTPPPAEINAFSQRSGNAVELGAPIVVWSSLKDATVTQEPPVPVQNVIWRASSHGLNEPEESKNSIQPASWHVIVKSPGQPTPPETELPKELCKITLPTYVIEPPDIILINAVRLIPRPPYRLEPLDEIIVQAPPKETVQPINGTYPVGPDGTVDLGVDLGKVNVAGKTTEEAREAMIDHYLKLNPGIKRPALNVALGRTRALQIITGEHLVGMDGMVHLGTYGDVYVAGMTRQQAKQAIEAHLSTKLLAPEVSVDVVGYNSKVYYVIFDGGGFGQQIFKHPIVGGETVLDALADVHGLPAVSSERRIWLARPVPDGCGHRQILPVDWEAITQAGATSSNYQLMPGDRVYVRADHWVAFENCLHKVLHPFEGKLHLLTCGQ